MSSDNSSNKRKSAPNAVVEETSSSSQKLSHRLFSYPDVDGNSRKRAKKKKHRHHNHQQQEQELLESSPKIRDDPKKKKKKDEEDEMGAYMARLDSIYTDDNGAITKGSIANLVLHRIGRLNADYLQEDPFANHRLSEEDKIAEQQREQEESLEESGEEEDDTTKGKQNNKELATTGAGPVGEDDDDDDDGHSNDEVDEGGGGEVASKNSQLASADAGAAGAAEDGDSVDGGPPNEENEQIAIVNNDNFMRYRVAGVAPQNPQDRSVQGRRVAIISGPYKGCKGRIAMSRPGQSEWVVVRGEVDGVDDHEESLWTVHVGHLEPISEDSSSSAHSRAGEGEQQTMAQRKKKKVNPEIMRKLKCLFLKTLDEHFNAPIEESKRRIVEIKHRANAVSMAAAASSSSSSAATGGASSQENLRRDGQRLLWNLDGREQVLKAEVKAHSVSRVYAMHAFDEAASGSEQQRRKDKKKKPTTTSKY